MAKKSWVLAIFVFLVAVLPCLFLVADASAFKPGTWTLTGSLNTARLPIRPPPSRRTGTGGQWLRNHQLTRQLRTLRPGHRDLDCH